MAGNALSERCPLGPGLYWENEDEIPAFCIERCGKLMDSIAEGPPLEEYDYFLDNSRGDECRHDNLETEDCSLQRTGNAERIFSITDECIDCGVEYGAQSYRFICLAEKES